MADIEQIVLASKSVIRKTIMESLALPFLTEPSSVDESSLLSSSPENIAKLRAQKKAEDVARRTSLSLVIGCDQVLSFGDRVFSKPKSEEEACEHLRCLQGGEHYLLSAVSLYFSRELDEEGYELCSWISPACMKMRPLSEEEVKAYVATGEWRGSVGAYKIEGKGAELFYALPEDFDKTVIMGFPKKKLVSELQKLGLDLAVTHPLPFRLKL